MSTYKNLMTVCCAAVLALGLAACGGGGPTAQAPSTPSTPSMPTPAAPTADSLKADAADAITAAAAAGMAAEQAKKDAAKYAGMLTAEKVNGESADAVANAQKVLNAEMAANDAVMAADDALTAAMDAKTAAEALPEDDPGRASAIAAAEHAIKQATTHKKAAMGIVDEAATEAGSLKASVQTVKGDNPLLATYPKMPAAFGKDVATSVKTALGSITRVSDLATLTADTVPDHATQMNDASGIEAMTWAMIVGEDNVMMQRIGADNAALPVASIAGMMASAVDKTATPALSATGGTNGDGKYDDATAVGTATVTGTPGTEYKGIPGAVWCLGGADGCSVNADGTLSSGWYFTPTLATELYVANPRMAGSYVVAMMYARYGYWLAFDASGAATGITIGAALGNAGTNTASLNLIRPASATADVTASYSGNAAGISTRGDASGHFTANVSLTATFGEAITDSSLSGFISGFEGNAVNPNWRVTLNKSALTADGALGTDAADGIAYGGAGAGTWTAQGYGPAPIDPDGDGPDTAQSQRPEGFFGTFNANFTDGMAAGAYATRKP